MISLCAAYIAEGRSGGWESRGSEEARMGLSDRIVGSLDLAEETPMTTKLLLEARNVTSCVPYTSKARVGLRAVLCSILTYLLTYLLRDTWADP